MLWVALLISWSVTAAAVVVCGWLIKDNTDLKAECRSANDRADANYLNAQPQLPGCNAELETRLRQRESELRDARLEIDHLTELLAQTESDNRELTVRVGVEDAFRRGVVELLARRSNGDLMPQGETVEAGK